MSSDSSQTKATRGTLLERMRSNDNEAWNDFVEVYSPLVFYWIRQRGIRRREDQLDIAQKVFLAVSQSIGKFDRRQTGSFRAWLYSITQHKISDFRRERAGKEQPAGGTANQAVIEQVEEMADSLTGWTATPQASPLWQILKKVKAEFQGKDSTWDAFYRTVIDQKPTYLVATELNMTEANIRKAKSRILQRIKAHLPEDEDQGLSTMFS